MKGSYTKIFTPLYLINIIFQAFITLISPIAIMLGIAYLLSTYLSVGSWIYVVLILLGVFVGIISMIRFLISALAGLERLEKEQQDSDRLRK